MHTEQSAIRDELKPIERRLTDLDKNIKGVYRQYKQQKPKDQEAFFEKFSYFGYDTALSL